MADFNTVATQFTQYYYTTFDAQKDKSPLAALYRDASMLTFETNQVMGVAAIVEKLNSLPFQSVAHKVVTLDAQPAGPNGSIMVLVTGELVIDGGEHPQKYSQAFHLIPEAGSYYVLNDIFRLVYG